jgi:hypothetical protein
MIRLKVRLASTEAVAKIIRVSEEIEFPMLLEKIAHRLGVPRSTHEDKEQWRLLLGGDVLIEDTQEIDDGDDLVLITSTSTQPVNVKPEVEKETTKSSSDKHSYVNRRIAKVFDNQVYFGTIDRFVKGINDNIDQINPFWHVQYDDGDEEEFYEPDLHEVLELYEKEKESDTQTNTITGPESMLNTQEDADSVEDVTEQVLKEKKRRLEDQAVEFETESENDKEQKDDEDSSSMSSDEESDFQQDDNVLDSDLSEDLEQVVQTVRESKKKKKASANKEPPLQVFVGNTVQTLRWF